MKSLPIVVAVPVANVNPLRTMGNLLLFQSVLPYVIIVVMKE